jgi:ubiquinone biosynthesis protein COQ4
VRNRIRWGAAALAFAQTVAKPSDIIGPTLFLRATEGASGQRAFVRLAGGEAGQCLLRERPSLAAHLGPALEAYAPGTLGAACFAFMAQEGVSLSGLLALPRIAADRPMTEAERWFVERIHAMHDLRHVVCGYRTDRLGEVCLLAFRCAQVGHPGMRILCALGTLMLARQLRRLPVRAAVAEARERGRNAAWIEGVAWEEKLDRDLDAVRRELGIAGAPVYERIVASISA